jgi:phage replication initiation protein
MQIATFSPVEAGNSLGQGPTTNRGQKSPEPAPHGALIDFLTVVFPASRLEECSATDIHYLLPMIFGTGEDLKAGGIRDKAFQFYRKSSSIFDLNGELCGAIGLDGNNETICVSLSGVGCRWVKDWAYVMRQLSMLNAHISRSDVAYDDYDGKLINVHAMRDMARSGEGFSCGGRPPKSSFLDDHGSGEGCTLYVGAKGHKQLCVYEKGKQLGDQSSPWTRVEVRFYGKHAEVLLEVLTKPLEYLRGAYPILQNLLPGLSSRLQTVVRSVEASATAMVRWLKTQAGSSLNLLIQTIGKDQFGEWCHQNLARERQPSRFAKSGAAPGDLPVLLRCQLC